MSDRGSVFEVGDVIGSYTILAHLRTGGMASLYLARRAGAAGFSRLVAIKVVHPRHAEDSGLIRMFIDEALLTARIDHPNVVHVEELGEREGLYYLVMEYVHGASLAQLMRVLGKAKRRLSPLVAVAICSRVAEGLHAAHETTGDNGELLRIVHRDVSPQNILLSHKGHVKLIDFGIAKAQVHHHESNVSSLKGKVRYMAPEQATTGVVDRRTDVYALGIVLWELLTMRRLFSGRNEFEILMSVRKPRVVAPSRYATEIPPELDAIVLRALAIDPEQRFANAKEFRRQLVRALPRSAAIDSAHIADLLVQVMGDELDKVRHELPQEISIVLRAELQRVIGLEEEERQKSVDDIPAEKVHEPSGMVDVYTLHSGEIQFEEEDSPVPEDAPAAAKAAEEKPEAAEPEATVRAERPPELAAMLLAKPPPSQPELAPAPQAQTSDESLDAGEITEVAARADVQAIVAQVLADRSSLAPSDTAETPAPTSVEVASWPDAPLASRPPESAGALEHDDDSDDDSPTEVSGRQPTDDPYAKPIVPLPEVPAPQPGLASRELAGYGLALGVSMCIGVALAFWGPSCEGEPSTPPAAGELPTAALPAPPSVAPVSARPAPPDAAVPLAEDQEEDDVETGRERRRGRFRRPGRGGREKLAPSIVGGVPIARDLDP